MKTLTEFLMFCLCLGACTSPSPAYLGATRQDVTVDGSHFAVFRQPGGNGVEVHRVSIEALPSQVLTFEKAYRAIGQVTGCAVVDGSLRGDRAILLAKIDCTK